MKKVEAINECNSISLSNGPVFTRTFIRDPYRKHLINAVSNLFDGVSVSAAVYTHDLLSRRTNIVMTAQTGTNVLSCSYNARSEVTGATIDNNKYSYLYDNIGNSLFTSLNAVTNAYTVNNLNQYTAITDPVNPVNPVYDLDGNMVTNGVWSFTYDAENRMIDAYSNDTLLASNTYDHLSRRIRKAVSSSDRSFVWDGWNLIHERVSHTNGTIDEIEYVWGLDLSGALQGAGGVGGLLFEKRNGAIYIPCYDANGNITAYLDEAGVIRAYRVYDVFGNTIAKGGDMVDVFHFWYSTKYLDHDTGLYYYGYRYYSPMLQRWINRDPIEERGGINLYGFCHNDPQNKIDYLGCWTNPKRKGDSWARVCCQEGDSWNSLAKKIGLDVSQASSWVLNYEAIPKTGKRYFIPNTVVLYIAQPQYYLFDAENKLTMPMDIPLYPLDGGDIMRSLAGLAASGIETKGYKIVRKTSNDPKKLISSWKTSGIWGFIYGGHGVAGMLVTSPKFNKGVFQHEVSAKYKLAVVALFACDSSHGEWQKRVSQNGLFFGYDKEVTFFSAHQIEVTNGQE